VKRSERHRLKHDVYADRVVHLAVWARLHQTQLLVGVAAVLFIAASVVWVTLSHHSAEEAALEILAEVETRARAAVFAKPAEQADAVKDVAARCDLLAADHPNSDATPLALLRAGMLYCLIGRAREAVPYFERALELGDDRPGLAGLARRGLAEALEASAKYRQAIEQYRLLVEDGAGATRAQVNWDIGRCYDQLGEPDQAESFYTKAVQDGGDSGWADLARSRLAHRETGN